VIAPKLEPPTARAEREAYELVTLRDGETCQRCLRSDCGPTQRDHRLNRSQGGWTVVENLQLLGMLCHSWKTDHPDDACRNGWGVPAWAHWSWYPARRWIRTAVNTHRLAWVLYVGNQVLEISPEDAADRIAGLRGDVPELVS